MPKTTKTKSIDRKLKKHIESNLFKVYLKVDDYIYCNQPILATEALALKEQVCSYKKLCSKDERILQVIDKLSNILNGIIMQVKSSKSTENHQLQTVDQKKDRKRKNLSWIRKIKYVRVIEDDEFDSNFVFPRDN